MQTYTCAYCGIEFQRATRPGGENPFCSKKHRASYHSRRYKQDDGAADHLRFRMGLKKTDAAIQSAMKRSSSKFEDARISRGTTFRISRPMTVVPASASSSAWEVADSTASGREDKQYREFPPEISVAPLRCLGQV